jgi:hypothetical protein
MKERTLSSQLEKLQKLVDSAFVKTAKEVKGAFTTGEYVTWLLNDIFGPFRWNFTILQGPELITLSEQAAYAQVVGRLEVVFADGTKTHQDDIGIWPLVATGARKGGTLEDTAPERYETACKAARTDCLKNAAYNFGTCFAPLSDGVLVRWLEQSEVRKHIAPLVEGKTAEENAADLFDIARAREGDVEDEIVRREAAANAGKRKTGQRQPSRRGQNRWQAFLEENSLTEKAALSALGTESVIDWMKTNPGKSEQNAYDEILSITGKA